MTLLTESSHVILFLALAQIILIIFNVPESEGLTFNDLTSASNPVIPADVRDAGNVTVKAGSDGTVSVTFRGLPNHETMKVNPNEPEAQDFMVDFPEYPQLQSQETCLGGGPIGWTIYGVALYNPFNALGTNAVEGDEAEIFDSCQGHPDMFGVYHYHQLPDNCVFQGVDTGIIGIALDGFPIYGPYKEDGTMVKESELDKCHGRCGPDGYRYHITKTFPYIIGCYRGSPVTYSSSGMGQGMGPDGGPPTMRPSGQPPSTPPQTGRRRRQAGSPNQCAYNTVMGDMYEFQTCSGKLRLEATFALACLAGICAWMHKMCYL